MLILAGFTCGVLAFIGLSILLGKELVYIQRQADAAQQPPTKFGPVAKWPIRHDPAA